MSHTLKISYAFPPAPWKKWHDFDEGGDTLNYCIGPTVEEPIAVTLCEDEDRANAIANLLRKAPELVRFVEDVYRNPDMMARTFSQRAMGLILSIAETVEEA